jgi:Na+/proline symporter
VTAFNTVWTYDIYQTYIAKDKPDAHYLLVARLATVFGIALSIAPPTWRPPTTTSWTSCSSCSRS